MNIEDIKQSSDNSGALPLITVVPFKAKMLYFPHLLGKVKKQVQVNQIQDLDRNPFFPSNVDVSSCVLYFQSEKIGGNWTFILVLRCFSSYPEGFFISHHKLIVLGFYKYDAHPTSITLIWGGESALNQLASTDQVFQIPVVLLN